MSIFDILGSGPLGAVLDAVTGQKGGYGNSGMGGLGGLGGLGGGLGEVINTIANQTRNAANTIQQNTPAGMGGLLGAGALGAVLGNLMSSNAVKGVALAGASAVAWNFYKKWAAGQAAEQEARTNAPQYNQVSIEDGYRQSHAQFGDTPQELPPAMNPVGELVVRSMIYAARADGTIQPEEKERIDTVLTSMFPGEDTAALISTVSKEPIDPAKIASNVKSHEQGEDVYRLSCATIDIDHFMERGYLDALAKALKIDEAEQKQIEAEAIQAKQQLEAAVRK